jgi:RNA polymerase sigma-70 factor (ECF subfamily)
MPELSPRPDPRHRVTGTTEHREPDLVRRAQLGSALAFEQLVLARGPHLHRFLRVRLRDETEALDVLQETLTAAWQALPGLKATARFWPWLCGIAEHKATDAARRRRPPVAGDESVQRASARSADSGALLEVREAVAALPEKQRQVVLLRYVLELSENEVADALGVRVGTVKSRSARARAALEELLR